ncbi:uncharacterized protein [Amphiura filiformis]|uniref:uncharacterized protein n=1 Tax=Amphiura filiformis TaxID=82378 RepID=UPI003B20D792
MGKTPKQRESILMCDEGMMNDDDDECGLRGDNCDVNAVCINNDGSFTCACNDGYTGDGITCSDMDECALNTDNCDENAVCSNNDGSFACACNAGYTGNGLTCSDKDECDLNTDNCDVNAVCSNNDGSFTCACNVGYTGDGVTCSVCDEAWTPIGDGYYKTCEPAPEGEESQQSRTCCTQPYGKSVCESFGAHLADIKSQTEQTNLVNWLTSIKSKDVWLGLYSPIPGGDLFYSDGTPLGSYAPWSSVGRNEQVSCVRMEQNKQFKWSDRHCDQKYGYLCEKNATSG